MSHYSTLSGDEFASSSKRRSRGPVMAAKKAAEGVFLCYHSFSRKKKNCLKDGSYSVTTERHPYLLIVGLLVIA